MTGADYALKSQFLICSLHVHVNISFRSNSSLYHQIFNEEDAFFEVRWNICLTLFSHVVDILISCADVLLLFCLRRLTLDQQECCANAVWRNHW